MPISKTKRAFHILIYVVLFVFITHYADQVIEQIGSASSAIESIQGR